MSIFNPSQWAADHFHHAELGDKRRAARLTVVAEHMAVGSGKSVARSCNGEDAKLEGAYRLIRNDNVSPSMIRVAGFARTTQAVENVDEILALEDTTAIHPQSKMRLWS